MNILALFVLEFVGNTTPDWRFTRVDRFAQYVAQSIVCYPRICDGA